MYLAARAVLFQMDPEHAHELTIKGLSKIQHTPLKWFIQQKLAERPVELMGLRFPNPVGLAAGLDKNAECIDAFAAMGFGHIEVGTVTPRAQPGNPQPRLFRVKPAQGIINRMGFNNLGVDNLIQNVQNSRFDGILGINIGKNFDTPVEQGKDDYLTCMEKVYPYASYIAVNISSPNTPGLRSLQYGEMLDDLLADLKVRQKELADQYNKYKPIALKIAPDLSDDEIAQIADALVRHQIDGVIATNTTLERNMIAGLDHAPEAGGLSGRPLQNKSTYVISRLKHELQDKLPIIGVGGIDSVMAAREKTQAGAQLLQVYSGFIYHGPKLIADIVKYL